jgi:hypothetical protein
MSFLNNDDFHDLRRQEEYERQKSENVVRGVGNFFYKVIGFWIIWLSTATFSTTIIEKVFSQSRGMAYLIGLILSFIIFKVPYVKENPYKSFIIICFVFGLFVVAFPDNS